MATTTKSASSSTTTQNSGNTAGQAMNSNSPMIAQTQPTYVQIQPTADQSQFWQPQQQNVMYMTTSSGNGPSQTQAHVPNYIQFMQPQSSLITQQVPTASKPSEAGFSDLPTYIVSGPPPFEGKSFRLKMNPTRDSGSSTSSSQSESQSQASDSNSNQSGSKKIKQDVRCASKSCRRKPVPGCKYCFTHGGRRKCSESDCAINSMDGHDVCRDHMVICKSCTKRAVSGSSLCYIHGGRLQCSHPGCTSLTRGNNKFCKSHDAKTK